MMNSTLKIVHKDDGYWLHIRNKDGTSGAFLLHSMKYKGYILPHVLRQAELETRDIPGGPRCDKCEGSGLLLGYLDDPCDECGGEGWLDDSDNNPKI